MRLTRLATRYGLFVALLALVLTQRATSASAARHPQTMQAVRASGQPSPCQSFPFTWTLAASQNVASAPNTLRGMAAISSTDIWAVGYYKDLSTDNLHTLTEHWNGAVWSIVPSVDPIAGGFNALLAVSAISSTDVWAVGFSTASGTANAFQTLTEHWNGSKWSAVASANASGVDQLLGVTALSSDDVWAVGNVLLGQEQTLIEHWDGTQWTVVSSPNVASTTNQLSGVAGVASNDVWAVGTYQGNFVQPLAEHWNGTQWSIVSVPTLPTETFVSAVAAISSSDVWAVGSTGGASLHSVTEHWNGTAWQIEQVPGDEPMQGGFFGVTAVTANDVWAVGFARPAVHFQTLIENWNGRRWSVVQSAEGSPYDNFLRAAIALAPNNVWAVGDAATDSTGINTNTLAEHTALVPIASAGAGRITGGAHGLAPCIG